MTPITNTVINSGVQSNVVPTIMFVADNASQVIIISTLSGRSDLVDSNKLKGAHPSDATLLQQMQLQQKN